MVQNTQQQRKGAGLLDRILLCDSPCLDWMATFLETDRDRDRRLGKIHYSTVYGSNVRVMDLEEQKRRKESERAKRRPQVLLDFQMSVACLMMKQHFEEFMTTKEPSEKLVAQLARCLNPDDPSFTKQVELNKLNASLTVQSKTLRQLWQEQDVLDKDIAALLRYYKAQQDLVSRFKKLKPIDKERRLKKAIVKHRREAGEVVKKTERLDSYGQLFYYLQTNPVYLLGSIRRLKSVDIKAFTEGLLLPLFNRGNTPREEYHFIKLMEFSLRKEVEEKIGHIEEILDKDSVVLQIILHYYTEKPKYQDIFLALGTSINCVMAVNDELGHEEEAKTILGKLKKIFKIHNCRSKAYLDNLINTFVDTILEYVYRIPYGLRYLTKVLHQSLQKKFPNESRDSLLWPVGYFLAEYLRTGIEEPEKFDTDVCKQSHHKKNLLLVSHMLQQTLTSFAPHRASSHRMKTTQNLRAFFRKVMDAQDLEMEYNVTQYTDAVHSLTLTMTAEDIINIHSLLSKYQRYVFCLHGDLPTAYFMFRTFRKIGPVPLLEDLEDTDGAVYNEAGTKTIFSLCLLGKLSPLNDFDVKEANTRIYSDQIAHSLKATQTEEKIQSLLKEAQEISLKSSSETEQAQKKKKKSGSSKERAAAQEAQLRRERLEILQKAGFYPGARNAQEFLELLYEKIRKKHQLRSKRKSEVETSVRALEKVKGVLQDLQKRIDLYKRFRKNCINNLFSEKPSLDGRVDRIHFAEDQVVYMAKELCERGVIVTTYRRYWGMKKDYVCIKPAGEYLQVQTEELCQKVPIMEILHAHHSDNPTMKILQYDIAVGMFLFLICSTLSKGDDIAFNFRMAEWKKANASDAEAPILPFSFCSTIS